MAEIAIPILALGAMYFISNNNNNDEDDDEYKSSESNSNNYSQIKEDFKNLNERENNYNNTNKASRHYFNQFQENEDEKDRINRQNRRNAFNSLSGNTMTTDEFKLDSMKPFFGSKVKQRTSVANDSILDSYSGSGKQINTKKETAPLFKPEKDMSYINGAPNHNDFIRSRMHTSNNMANTKPWEEIRVAPGLNKGYTTEGNNGFNSGLEERDVWKDKTVDELRTLTNPKMTYDLTNHQGPALSNVTNLGTIGRVEKNRPDTYFENTSNKWLITTGRDKAQRYRSEEPMRVENRTTTTREYYGNANCNTDTDNAGGRAEENYRQSERPELRPDSDFLGAAHNIAYGGDKNNMDLNYGRQGYKSYSNSRNTTNQSSGYGSVNTLVKASMAPIIDIFRPTRKEETINNLRTVGNVGGKNGVNEPRKWNPSDRPRTTIKEQTENTYSVAHPHKKHEGGYETNPHQSIDNQRLTTSKSYTGSMGATPGTRKTMVYETAYNANLNPNKEVVSKNKISVGCGALFTGGQNILSRNDNNMCEERGPINMPKESAHSMHMGETQGNYNRGNDINGERNTSDILNAFNSNPYTKSLHSIA